MLKRLIFSLILSIVVLQATTPERDSVTKLYVATFERAPESDGLNYWVKQSILTLEGVAQSFFDQKETKELYPPDYTNERFIEAVYQNLFNRKADVDGKKYWLEALDDGRVDRSVFILAAINGAKGDDAILLDNKTVVGLAFANAQISNIDDAREIMWGITADEDSVDSALRRFGLLSDSDSNEAEEPSYSKPKSKPVFNISQKGWYVRISVQSSTLKDDQAVIGYLQGASDGKDKYDSEALSSSGLYTTIYHQDFGKKENYRSDYRSYKESGTKSETWILRVNYSRDTNADITMSWDGITFVEKKAKLGFSERVESSSPELQNMRLVDEEGGRVINISQESSYSFNMNGKKSREFKWVMLADGEDEPQ